MSLPKPFCRYAMKTIRLREHESCIHEGLELRPADWDLAERLSNTSVLEIREAGRQIKISADHHVGMARFSDFEVVVEPKIGMEPQNLPRLVAYAFGFDDIKMMQGEAGFVHDQTYLVDILIGFFTWGCGRLISQGLLKSYLVRRDNVPFLRGRLLPPLHMGNTARKRPAFACEFDDLEYDNLENRILLYCLKRCTHITGSPRLKKEAARLAAQLSGAVRYAVTTPEEITSVQYTRMNRHYKPLLRLAALITGEAGIGRISGPESAASFFVDMNDVFERFVARLFKEYHPLKSAYQKSRHAWSAGGQRLYIRTDILLDSHIVVDSKYKEELSRNDLYQIGFYIHEYRQKTGYAILPAHPSATNRDIISETGRVTVSVRFVDIDQMLHHIHANEHAALLDVMCRLVPA